VDSRAMLYRKSYSMRTSMLVEYTLFKTLYTSPNVVVFHRNNIRRSFFVYILPRFVRPSFVDLQMNTYACRYLSTLFSIPIFQQRVFFLFAYNMIRVFALWRTEFLLTLQCVRVIYRICYVDKIIYPEFNNIVKTYFCDLLIFIFISFY